MNREDPISLSLTNLPKESFFRRFAELNQLGYISHFLFQSGMLFSDAGFWWRGERERPALHEGLDIFFMQGIDGEISSVAARMLVPAFLSGQQVHFHRDFLGETIYIQHPEMRLNGAVLHTLYGHLHPESEATHPFCIKKGEELGVISSPPESSAVPAHLHISCAWIAEDQRLNELSWETMAASSSVVFIDPFPFLLR